MTDAELRAAVDVLVVRLVAVRVAGVGEEAEIGESLNALLSFICVLSKDTVRYPGIMKVGAGEPLVRLIQALAALDAGTRDPILQPNPTRRRVVLDEAEDRARGVKPGVPLYVLMERANAAASMQLLLDTSGAGVKLETAARAVARVIGEDWRRVKRWRDEIMQLAEQRTGPLPLDAPHTAQAAVRFNRVVARAREWAVEAGPEVVARFALERLRHRPESAKSGLAGRKPTSPD